MLFKNYFSFSLPTPTYIPPQNYETLCLQCLERWRVGGVAGMWGRGAADRHGQVEEY